MLSISENPKHICLDISKMLRHLCLSIFCSSEMLRHFRICLGIFEMPKQIKHFYDSISIFKVNPNGGPAKTRFRIPAVLQVTVTTRFMGFMRWDFPELRV